MPDTQPITQSFPWFVMRYRAVFDNRNIVGGSSLPLAEGFQKNGFQVSPAFQTGSAGAGSPGDLYRYI